MIELCLVSIALNDRLKQSGCRINAYAVFCSSLSYRTLACFCQPARQWSTFLLSLGIHAAWTNDMLIGSFLASTPAMKRSAR